MNCQIVFLHDFSLISFQVFTLLRNNFCLFYSSRRQVKVNRSQNKIVEPKLLPKNEGTNLFFYPDSQFWAENNLT